MIKRNDEFERIADIMRRFGKQASPVRTPNRGYTAGGHLVHILIIGSAVKAAAGVTNRHGPGITWDEIYMDSTNGGLRPDESPKKQALFVKDANKKERTYTFRGIYEVDTACSTEFSVTHRRIANEVDETLPEWRILRLN